jgi:hypothetical protein
MPDAAAARGALEHHRIADAVRLGTRMAHVVEQLAARQQGHVVRSRERAGRVLQPEAAHLFWRWPDEGDAGLLARFGEIGVLAEEPVARMDRLRPGGARGLQDAIGAQVAVCAGRRSHAHRPVRLHHVRRVGIGLGVDRDGLDAEPAGGADDPAGDGAAVGDEDLGEHRKEVERLEARG